MNAQFTDRDMMYEFLAGLHLICLCNTLSQSRVIIDIETKKVVGRVHEMVKGTFDIIIDMDQ